MTVILTSPPISRLDGPASPTARRSLFPSHSPAPRPAEPVNDRARGSGNGHTRGQSSAPSVGRRAGGRAGGGAGGARAPRCVFDKPRIYPLKPDNRGAPKARAQPRVGSGESARRDAFSANREPTL